MFIFTYEVCGLILSGIFNRMSLVNYSSSDEKESCSDEDIPTFTEKRSNDADSGLSRLSKKAKIEVNEKQNTETNRIRTFAHERGNWATFIYIPIPYNDSVQELQTQIAKSFENDSNIKLNIIESLHVSLTRTVVLQHHWIDAFTKSVMESISDFKRFTLNLDKINVYCNDERTTTFVSVDVSEIYSAPLKTLVEKFNNCLGEYKLPSFYEDASFHVSILWCLGNQKSKILMEIEKLQRLLLAAIDDDYEDYHIVVNRIECKVGNKVYNYPLIS